MKRGDRSTSRSLLIVEICEDVITLQDIPIVESQRPELLPLDLQAELHLRSDRTAISYRKWLRKLSLAFGTAYICPRSHTLKRQPL